MTYLSIAEKPQSIIQNENTLETSSLIDENNFKFFETRMNLYAFTALTL
jgi:hypothetical protein